MDITATTNIAIHRRVFEYDDTELILVTNFSKRRPQDIAFRHYGLRPNRLISVVTMNVASVETLCQAIRSNGGRWDDTDQSLDYRVSGNNGILQRSTEQLTLPVPFWQAVAYDLVGWNGKDWRGEPNRTWKTDYPQENIIALPDILYRPRITAS